MYTSKRAMITMSIIIHTPAVTPTANPMLLLLVTAASQIICGVLFGSLVGIRVVGKDMPVVNGLLLDDVSVVDVSVVDVSVVDVSVVDGCFVDIVTVVGGGVVIREAV